MKAKLRTFKHFPHDSTCPICKGNEDGECILVGIDGTEDGHNMQALPVHTGCLSLRFKQDAGVLYQFVGE